MSKKEEITQIYLEETDTSKDRLSRYEQAEDIYYERHGVECYGDSRIFFAALNMVKTDRLPQTR